MKTHKSIDKVLNRKTQVVIYDFLAAFVIFAIVILVVAMLWFRTSAQIANDLTAESKMKAARDVANILIKTGGYPQKWEYNISDQCLERNCSLGLAIDDNVLSQEKINGFLNIANNDTLPDYGYNRTKSLLKIKDYDFYFAVRDKYGNLINETGKEPSANLSINIKRAVLVGTNETIIEVSLY